MKVPSPPVPDWTIIRLENLALIETGFTRDSERLLEILHGSECSHRARFTDAIALATYVISRLADPAAVLAELRRMAIEGNPDGEIDR